jgi:hypothetical protein
VAVLGASALCGVGVWIAARAQNSVVARSTGNVPVLSGE